MTTKLTKKGALQVSKALDRIASVIQEESAVFGLNPKIANDFAHRCDLLSDHVEKRAGVEHRALTEYDPVKETGFNPEEIGVEKSGPLEMIDSDEPYMNGEFTQQENRELRYDQQGGKLGPDKTTLEPQNIPAGKQAFEKMGRQAVISRMDELEGTLHTTALKLASMGQNILAEGVTKLAQTIMDVQMGIANGTVTADQSEQVLNALDRVVPHIASVSPKTQSKVARMLDLAIHVAKDEDDKDDKKDDDKKDDKKDDSGKSFFEKMEEAKAKKKAKKSDDDEDDVEEIEGKKKAKKSDDDEEEVEEIEGKKKAKKSDDDEEEVEEVEGKKKASHGFTLDAE